MDFDEEDEARQIVGEAIEMLNSTNPYKRQQAIETIESYKASSAREMAYGRALQLCEKETDAEVKRGLLRIIVDYCRGRDRRALDIFIAEIDNLNSNISEVAFKGLKKYKENASPVLSKVIKMVEDPLTSSWSKRQIMGLLGAIGKKAEPAIHIITKELASKSWLMRRATRDAMKKLKKSGLNVVGYLINQLENGSVEEQLAACTGLGSLPKDAKGSVSALSAALKHENPEVRSKAAWALWKMGKNAAPAENALRESLDDESSAVSKYALKALKKMKKLSEEEKGQIKEMEEQEKLIKKFKKKFGYPELKEPKDGEEPEDLQYKNLFFMSHAVHDFGWVEKSMNIIESWPGCKCWVCERDIIHGMDWLEAIYNGIHECTWFILFWSENAKNSNWITDEIREAKTLHVSTGKPNITIVSLGMSEWPPFLSRHQGSVVRNDEDLEQFLVNIKSQIKF